MSTITDSKRIADLMNVEVNDSNLRHVRIATSKNVTEADSPFGKVHDETTGNDRPAPRKTTEFANDMDDAQKRCQQHEYDNATNYIYLAKTYDLFFHDEDGNVIPREDLGNEIDTRNLPETVKTVTQRIDNFKWSRKNGWRRDEAKQVEFRNVEPFRKVDSLQPVLAKADTNAPY